MEPVSIILMTLGLLTQVERMVNGVQNIVASREEARERRSQKRYFFRSIREIDDLIQTQQPLIPRPLFRVADRLSQYCSDRGRVIFRFYKNFQNRGFMRSLTWIGMICGRNQFEIYQTQLDDCEDWLNIALLTISLWVTDEARRRSVSRLPEDFTEWEVPQGSAEIQARDRLRQRLTRIQRTMRQRNRYRKMISAGIRLSELGRLAEGILDDPITESTLSVASNRPSQRDRRHPPQRNPDHRSRSPIDLSRSTPVFLRASERGRRPHSSQRPDYEAASEPAILDRRRVRDSQPERRYDRSDERAERQSSTHRQPSSRRQQISAQRRSSSTSRDPDLVDGTARVRREHVIRDTRPPPSYDPDNIRAGRRVHPRRRSSSASRNSDADDGSRRRSSSTGGDSGFADESPRIRTQHVLRSSRPPISNRPDQGRPGRRRRSSRSRSSSFGYDSGIEMAHSYSGYESDRR